MFHDYFKIRLFQWKKIRDLFLMLVHYSGFHTFVGQLALLLKVNK